MISKFFAAFSVVLWPIAAEEIVLQRWQYCAGCRSAVEIFSARVFPLMNDALEIKGETEKINLEPYTDGICQAEPFRHYKEFVEHGVYSSLHLLIITCHVATF